jgi:hypothetical protein
MIKKRIPHKWKIPIGEAVAYSIGLKETTKVCPVCLQPVMYKLYHISLADKHLNRQPPEGMTSLYGISNIYIHRHCFKKLYELVEEAEKKHKKTIEANNKWASILNI